MAKFSSGIGANAKEACFTKQAKEYNSRSFKFPLSLIRLFEKRKIQKALKECDLTNVLDLGSGSGYYTLALKELGALQVSALDINQAMLSEINCNHVIKRHESVEEFNDYQNYSTILSAGMLEFTNKPNKNILRALEKMSQQSDLILLLPRFSVLGLLYKIFHKKNNIEIQLFREKEVMRLVDQKTHKLRCFKKVFPFSFCLHVRKI